MLMQTLVHLLFTWILLSLTDWEDAYRPTPEYLRTCGFANSKYDYRDLTRFVSTLTASSSNCPSEQTSSEHLVRAAAPVSTKRARSSFTSEWRWTLGGSDLAKAYTSKTFSIFDFCLCNTQLRNTSLYFLLNSISLMVPQDMYLCLASNWRNKVI